MSGGPADKMAVNTACMGDGMGVRTVRRSPNSFASEARSQSASTLDGSRLYNLP